MDSEDKNVVEQQTEQEVEKVEEQQTDQVDEVEAEAKEEEKEVEQAQAKEEVQEEAKEEVQEEQAEAPIEEQAESQEQPKEQPKEEAPVQPETAPEDVQVSVDEKKGQEEETEKLGEFTWRSPKLKDGEPLLDTIYPGCYTMAECFKGAVKKYGQTPLFGYRTLIQMHKENREIGGVQRLWELPELSPINWLTYSEADQLIDHIGSGISNFAGLKAGDFMGIYLDTRMEWQATAHAGFRYAFTVSTLYANLGLDALEYVINQGQVKCILVAGNNVDNLIKIKDKIPTLTHVVYVGKLSTESDAFKFKSFKELVEDGKANPTPPSRAPVKDDLAVIMYTSGSTGMPKGVMMKQRQLVACASGVGDGIGISPADVYLGYLPLAHVLELVAENCIIFYGGRIAYGNPRSLSSEKVKNCDGDIVCACPTLMAGVPRVWDTIKKGINQKVKDKGGLSKFLFDKALAHKIKCQKKGVKAPISELILGKIKKKFGLTRIRACVSGGAPLHPETQAFMGAVLNCGVIQGYGLTETCGASNSQNPFNTIIPTAQVGPPLKSVEMKLVDVPSMGYYVTDKPRPRGEVWMRGNSITDGYYKAPEKTKEAYTPDGWFKSGDIGAYNPNGSLSIVDRKKNLVKLSFGEYVSLEALEMMYYSGSSYIFPNGICIYADSNRSNIVAVCYPNPPYCQEWAQKNGVAADDFKALCKNPQLKKTIMADLDRVAKEKGKARFEYIKDLIIDDEEWTPENVMLTSAMKLKRQNIYKANQPELQNMVDALEK